MQGKISEIARAITPSGTKFVPDNFINRGSFLSDSIVPEDILATSAKGATLKTNTGVVIDLSSMTVNCVLGQNDFWVTANLSSYLHSGKPSFLTTKIASELFVNTAKRILDVSGFDKGIINHRQCNGTDVTELSILAAYNNRKKGRDHLLTFSGSYHGQSLLNYVVSGLQRHHKFFFKDDPVTLLPDPTNSKNSFLTEDLSKHDKNILDTIYQNRNKAFAILMEPIQVNNSLNIPSKAFIQALAKLCREIELPLIYDEVQTGFGWLGKISAGQLFETKPNIVNFSKALTSGYGPLSVMVADKKFKNIKESSGAKTNGADLRSLVATNAVMDRLLGTHLPRKVRSLLPSKLILELETGLLRSFPIKQTLIRGRLDALAADLPGIIEEVFGIGLFFAVKIKHRNNSNSVEKTQKLQKLLLKNGVFVRTSKDLLLLKPSVVITQRELDIGLGVIKRTLKSIYK